MLWTGTWNSHEVSNQSPCSQTVHKSLKSIKAINSVPHHPRLWLGYVDHTTVIQREEHSNKFMQNFNSIDPHISSLRRLLTPKFPFLFWTHYLHQEIKTHSSLQSTGSPPTLTSTYNGTATAICQLSIVCSILSTYRAITVCTTTQVLLEEEQHISKALSRCKCPICVLNIVKNRKFLTHSNT